MRPIDFGKTASDYGAYRAGFPEALYDRLAKFGIGETGQRLLDLGTGTGYLGRGFARAGCRVTGLDPSDALIDEARRLDSEAGVASEYVTARAEHTGLPDATFDVVAAGQCWHWFDRAAAAAEVRRLLAPGGALVIAHFDWIPLPGNLAEATERLIEAHNPEWTLGGGEGLPREWLADVAMAGFRDLETFPSMKIRPTATRPGAAASGPAPGSAPACPRTPSNTSMTRSRNCSPNASPKTHSRCCTAASP